MTAASGPGNSVFVDVGRGTRLHARIAGSGPPLLLLHGFTGSSRSWDHLVEMLAPHASTVAVDLPGHGLTTTPNDPACYRLDWLADAVAHLLHDLQFGSCALLGYSMGGRAALQLALGHGSLVSSLVLESTSPGMADNTERMARRAADAELASYIEREGVAAFVRRWEQLPLWSSQAGMPEPRRRELRTQRLQNHAEGLANSLRGAGAAELPPAWNDLRTLSMPTLLVVGSLDLKYLELGEQMQREIPASELLVLPGAGHAAHLEQPEAFGRAVQEFLGKRAAGA